MIDVQGIFFNSLWILALAILLALLSWTSWQAEREGVRFRVVWARPGLRRLVTLSLVLFCAGMVAISGRWWERLLWVLLALFQLLPPFLARLSSRNPTKNDSPHG
ncbi:MAG: hypothetical protein BWY63_00603 [Chloroflexi bacterium ADurb.Bin360]|nr:MAG: hypothetical protein BWY63_00603 [Chloroflexi bacterium ADurb.Bin360]